MAAKGFDVGYLVNGCRRAALRPYRRWIREPWVRLRSRRMRRIIDEQIAALPQDSGFVQVGSNDGKSGDPVYRYATSRNWRGIVIEPVPYVFERLAENYRLYDRVVPVNVAIGNAGEIVEFYHLSEGSGDSLNFSKWYDQIGSFSRDHIIKHCGQAAQQYIRTINLECKNVNDLIEECAIGTVDLLHIDVEGADLMVLRQFDIARYHPKLVLYEHRHLSPPDRRIARELMTQHGYRLVVGPADTLCIRAE